MTTQDILDIYYKLSSAHGKALAEMIDEKQKYEANPDEENKSYYDRSIANWEQAQRAFQNFARLEWQ